MRVTSLYLKTNQKDAHVNYNPDPLLLMDH